MLFFQKEQEPLLHQAVIDACSEDLIDLIRQNNLHKKNSMGFNALELARLLNRRDCEQILSPSKPIKLKVILQGQNVAKPYSEEEFKKAFDVKYLPHLKFSSYESLKEVIAECPLILKYTDLGEENRTLGKRFQEEIAAGKIADVTIKWINPEMGYGVFANTLIEPGTFIGEYTGLVRRLSRFSPDHNGYCFHYPTRFFSIKYFLIDASKEGNILRFINHSDKPNLKPACLVDRGLLHLVLLANKPILRGCELTFDYGSDYWQARQKFYTARE